VSDTTTQTKESLTIRAAEKSPGRVSITYGIHSFDAEVAGRTVASVRAALSQPLGLHPMAVALVDGQEVDESYVLKSGESLELVRLAGEKGK
jgi:hypothetical protein